VNKGHGWCGIKYFEKVRLSDSWTSKVMGLEIPSKVDRDQNIPTSSIELGFGKTYPKSGDYLKKTRR
jgi:hypothetical protein